MLVRGSRERGYEMMEESGGDWRRSQGSDKEVRIEWEMGCGVEGRGMRVGGKEEREKDNTTKITTEEME